MDEPGNLDSQRIAWHDGREAVFERAFARVDIARVWRCCAGSGTAADDFRPKLRRALRAYDPMVETRPKLSAKERNKTYRKLEKATVTLLTELDEIHHQIWHELEDTFEYSAPQHADKYLTGTNEGLSYGEFQTERVITSVSSLLHTLRDAKSSHRNAKPGRPKQNESLEKLIRDLGDIYQAVSGCAPSQRLRYNPNMEGHEYCGPFMDFLSAAIWAFNGREFPQNNALGEAARNALGTR